MDKLSLITNFENMGGTSLGSDAVKLYLLLVADCDDAGYGKISLGTVRSAMGERFDPAKIREAGEELAALKLVKMVVNHSAEGKAFLLYRIRTAETEDDDEW